MRGIVHYDNKRKPFLIHTLYPCIALSFAIQHENTLHHILMNLRIFRRPFYKYPHTLLKLNSGYMIK